VAAELISLIGIEVTAFVATNIDDIVVLMIFFSSSNFQAPHVVIEQYLGIGSLVAIGALGSLIALVVPSYIIGLMGLVPIAIGIKELLERRNKNKVEKKEKVEEVSKEKLMQQQSNKKGYYRHHPDYLSFHCSCSHDYFKRR
jgi:cadmium resistance protein CadD (predicted permease)